MPRVSQKEKAKSHDRIVEQAARRFRQKGLEATGVAEIMAAAGLTHGGFYRHFKSKNDLIVTVFASATHAAMQAIAAAASNRERKEALSGYIDKYLSTAHIRNGDEGCILAALAVEAARNPGTVGTAAERGLAYVIDVLAGAIGGETSGARDRASMLFTVLLGTITLARTMPAGRDRDTILANGRKLALQLIDDQVAV